MQNVHETTSKSESQDTDPTTLPLRLAAGTCSSPDHDLAQPTRERVAVSKLDTKKQARKRGEKSLKNESHSQEQIVQIGAISVTTGVTDGTRNDHGANSSEMESQDTESPELASPYQAVLEAHMVDDSFAGLLEEEKEDYEKQTRERLLAEIAAQAAQAAVVVNEKKKQDGRLLLFRGCIMVMVVLVVAITTGVVLASKSSFNESAIPLSDTPEPSGQPSLMPTSEPRNNTLCEEAQPLMVGQNVSGNFNDAIGSTVISCGDHNSFASMAYSAPAKWYLYRGEGFPVIVRAAEFVDINVHLSCDSLGCAPDVRYPIWESTVLWEATLGTDYLILVFIPMGTEEDPSKINFTLTIETNDSRENAFGPLTPGPYTEVKGSTVGTKVASGIPACGSATVPTGPGVWYSVIGNGGTITASTGTCGSHTGLDTQISVFSAENICVDGNDDFCSGKSQVSWLSNVDEIYFVLVHGKDGAEGTFVLQITTEGGALADADFCANAKALEVGSTESVDLSHATFDPDIENCTWSTAGNFYTFIGTGKPVLVVLNNTSYYNVIPLRVDPGAVVLTGSSCSTLTCEYTFCEDGCHVPTNLGQTYFVNVYYSTRFIDDSDRYWLNGYVELIIEEDDDNNATEYFG